jgi:nickel transport protein
VKTATRLVLLVMAACLLPGMALAHALRLTAATSGGVISGHVFYSDETPAAGESVELQTPAGEVRHRVRSDATGRFVFPAVAPGAWRLVAEGEEGHRVEHGVVVSGPAGASSADLAALRADIHALREDLQRYEQRVRLGEVLGGLGLIAGLAGTLAWWRARRPARGD